MKTLDGLENVVAGLGTERDKSSYSRYGYAPKILKFELDSMYRSSWISKRVVNSVADDMTRAWRKIFFDGEQQFEVENLEFRLGLKDKINTALRYARLYGGSVLIIGVEDDDLETPLEIESVEKDALRYLLPLDCHRISGVGTVDDDLGSPNFGNPDMYMLTTNKTRLIHPSRLVRFEGQRVPWEIFESNGRWHDSELQHVYASIKSADTSSAAIATMLFESNVDVLKVAGLSDLITTECGEKQIIKRFQIAATMKSFNRVFLLDESETYEKKSNSFTNLDKIWEKFQIEVCGAADIPMTRLFGQSAAGLNATGDNDVRNYYDMINAKQETDLRPALTYLDNILVRSAFGTMPDDYRFEFNSLWQMSKKEKAEIGKLNAERDKIYVESGVITEGVAARELMEDGTYSSLTDDDVQLAEELNTALPTEEE